MISYEEYHPYGTSSYRAVNSAIDVSAKRYRYTAMERDEETCLSLHGARYYACWLGRWTAADPIGLGDGPNRYAYVSGRPLSTVDPSGAAGEDLRRGEIISQNQFDRAVAGELSISADDIPLRLPGDRGEHLVVPKSAVRYDRSVEGDEHHIGVQLESREWKKRFTVATLELQHRRQNEIAAKMILGSNKLIQGWAILGVGVGVTLGVGSAGVVSGAAAVGVDVAIGAVEGGAFAAVDGESVTEGAAIGAAAGLGGALLSKAAARTVGPLADSIARRVDDALDRVLSPGTARATVRGEAQVSSLVFRPNAGGEVRTVDEAMEIAREHGVEISDDIAFVAVPASSLPDGTAARYYRKPDARPGEFIAWDDFFHDKTGVMPVQLSEAVLTSDEAIVGVIAHEVHEIEGLRRIYASRGFQDLTSSELHRAISPGFAGNLHDQAWDVADALVRRMR